MAHRFIEGVLYAVQELVLWHGEPVYAAEIMNSSGISLSEFISAQQESGHDTMTMFRFFLTEFPELKNRKRKESNNG